MVYISITEMCRAVVAVQEESHAKVKIISRLSIQTC